MKTAKYQPTQLKALTLDRQVCLVRFSPCGKVLAAGGHDGTVRPWDASLDPMPPLPSLAGHHGWVTGLAFHPDGKHLFTADTWGQMRCWPYADQQPQALWTVKGRVEIQGRKHGQRTFACQGTRSLFSDHETDQRIAAGRQDAALAG
jgi:WD40 repeat protein